jgi:hypothetical protein
MPTAAPDAVHDLPLLKPSAEADVEARMLTVGDRAGAKMRYGRFA